jgi:Tfp pilus assembly protein PilO
MKANPLGRWRQRYVDWIALAVCLAAAVPLCFERVNPLFRPRDALAEQRSQIEQLQQAAGKLTDSVGRHKHKLAELNTKLKQQKVRLEPIGHINRRIARLTDLVEAAGLAVDEIRPAKPTSTLRYKIVPIHVTGSGRYPTCADFLRKLGKAFPDTPANSFELVGDPAKTEEVPKFQFVLHWYAAAD